MKTIELTDEAYAELLQLKNHISIKTREISNPKAMNHQNTLDVEPEYTFSECLDDVCKMIWHEQESGEVAYIT
jgi:predicted CopG family antitoxin